MKFSPVKLAGLVVGFTLLTSTGTAFADSTSSATLQQTWGNANVSAWQADGKVFVGVTLSDTASDGKCVYVEYKSDIRATFPGFEPHDPDKTVVKVCGDGETGSGSLSHDIGVFNYLDNVEFKMCKKGWAQDPCVKTFVHP